jgi:hypothetical protein
LLALSVIFAAGGSLVGWAVVAQYRSKIVDLALVAAAASFLANVMIELPAALIFFYG